jgi:hypothetical protein
MEIQMQDFVNKITDRLSLKGLRVGTEFSHKPTKKTFEVKGGTGTTITHQTMIEVIENDEVLGELSIFEHETTYEIKGGVRSRLRGKTETGSTFGYSTKRLMDRLGVKPA